MRLWSLHPKYLDAKGLVALWRETLLAKNVLEGKTKGYRHHPQLLRFQQCKDPLAAINVYLRFVFEEASSRGYSFDPEKFDANAKSQNIAVTKGQMEFECGHLLSKLNVRDPERGQSFSALKSFEPHPLFVIVDGEIESWEKV